MSIEVTIRPLEPHDIEPIAELLAALANEFILEDFEPAARATFLVRNDATAIRRFVADGFRYHVAEREGKLVGFVGTRDNSHLYHLFVEKSSQRRGVGRALWRIAQEACRGQGHEGPFTVNSSRYAIPVYERFGFVQSAPEQIKEGILYTPMSLDADG